MQSDLDALRHSLDQQDLARRAYRSRYGADYGHDTEFGEWQSAQPDQTAQDATSPKPSTTAQPVSG